jgi:prevent-host-death family protein
MGEVTIRELRYHGGEVLDRVCRGEALTVTRDGRPIAELRPLPAAPLRARQLLERWRRLPPVDPSTLQSDIDGSLEPRL